MSAVMAGCPRARSALATRPLPANSSRKTGQLAGLRQRASSFLRRLLKLAAELRGAEAQRAA
eukprot:9258018-Lingulodinium_polyedra.AAC.1